MFGGAVHQGVLSAGKASVHYGAGLLAISVGLIVWERRPGSRIGPLMTAAPLAAALGELPVVLPASAVAVTIGFAAFRLDAALFAHLTLSYPTGRLTSRPNRSFVVLVYGIAVAYALLYLLFYSPRSTYDPEVWDCPTCAVPYTHVAWYDVTGARHVLDAIAVGVVVVFLVLLVAKLVRASAGARRILLPLIAVLFVLAARFGVELALSLAGSPASFWTSAAMFWAETIGLFAIPVALAAGLLWGRSARSGVADLVVELDQTPPGPVRDALARALGDPSLELALWLPDRAAYVDGQGSCVKLPMPESGRAVTVLGPTKAPVAALVHDPALLEQQALLRSAGAAARLALENERLQAELRAQLAEVRASRARIVHAGDEERRRLERDLHDGAQQRLLGIRLALQLARGRLADGGATVEELLAEADAEVVGAIEELRALARGIHPAVLTEEGLAPALAALARRAPVPVVVTVRRERLPAPIESTAYFVAAEALANVAKHAHASRASITVTRANGRLAVEVADDGVGGADATGAGLRGLRDRVEALDGRLEVESAVGGGTRISAAIPCA
jgi:signal transduction histidine kinase